ncbi:uncharacterized protein LOC128739961 [Sabethes cyaneus]|uniref:uncharacterized protein LOC128739961 n=1 Tax=Sabethes cyaneus TaxID=53552 RepID=UPI00237D9763|nr:uncharacterized protein LOC128739961 [Sabethes cyaneus]
MEDNIISMFMDVKLDIKERKLEFSHLKSWAHYYVRVEAVKCFPCYMKICFFKSHTDESTDLIVRINIPGLTVQMATSRTRPHTYGLFWKNNRKRCCAYFALPSQLLCERHLRWMKKSIRNLELYRQEILQLRRASRTPICEREIYPDPSDNDLGIYQNLDITQNMVDVREILGPLPNVPDQTGNSRRISGFSGIYEEISDLRNSFATNACPRMSIASGIYEEMKLPDTEEQAKNNCEAKDLIYEIAPPLPPRPRSFTNEFILQRSFTTPEVDFNKKKKHWQIFDSMFGRRRTNSASTNMPNASEIKTTYEKEPLSDIQLKNPQKMMFRKNMVKKNLAVNKRNSFSSPDLSILKIYGEKGYTTESTDTLSNEGSCKSDSLIRDERNYIEEDCFKFSNFSITDNSSVEDSVANLLISEELVDNRQSKIMNVSERIISNFNISCNSSSVNLVGFDCTSNLQKELRQTLDVPPIPVGYCEMGAAGTGFDRQKLSGTNLNKLAKWENNETSLYVNMNNNITDKVHTELSSSSSSGVSSTYSSRSSVCSSTKSRTTIDDKIPSYYPNNDVRSPKRDAICSVRSESVKKQDESSGNQRTEDHYVVMSSPKSMQGKLILQNKSPSASRPNMPLQKPTSNSKSKHSVQSCSQSETIETPKQPILIVNHETFAKNIENNPPEVTPKCYLKYATIARSVSPAGSKYQEKVTGRKAAEAMLFNTSRRFASLPRFGRIDLSPLRLKINTVLQRHNAGNA